MTPEVVAGMVRELVAYKTEIALDWKSGAYRAATLPQSASRMRERQHDLLMQFWKDNLPNWVEFLGGVLLLQPSSGGAVRVLSHLKLVYGDMQMAALNDSVELACKLHYNNRGFSGEGGDKKRKH